MGTEFENEQIETVDIKFLLSQNSVFIVKEIFFSPRSDKREIPQHIYKYILVARCVLKPCNVFQLSLLLSATLKNSET